MDDMIDQGLAESLSADLENEDESLQRLVAELTQEDPSLLEDQDLDIGEDVSPTKTGDAAEPATFDGDTPDKDALIEKPGDKPGETTEGAMPQTRSQNATKNRQNVELDKQDSKEQSGVNRASETTQIAEVINEDEEHLERYGSRGKTRYVSQN